MIYKITKRLREKGISVEFTEGKLNKINGIYEFYFKYKKDKFVIKVVERDMEIVIYYKTEPETIDGLKMRKALISIVKSIIEDSKEYRVKLLVGYKIVVEELVSNKEISVLGHKLADKWLYPLRKTWIINMRHIFIATIFLILVTSVSFVAWLMVYSMIKNVVFSGFIFIIVFLLLGVGGMSKFVDLTMEMEDGLERRLYNWYEKKVEKECAKFEIKK